MTLFRCLLQANLTFLALAAKLLLYATVGYLVKFDSPAGVSPDALPLLACVMISSCGMPFSLSAPVGVLREEFRMAFPQ